jgi:hypothetical protein
LQNASDKVLITPTYVYAGSDTGDNKTEDKNIDKLKIHNSGFASLVVFLRKNAVNSIFFVYICIGGDNSRHCS